MARPTGSDGTQTRERILDVALELFTQQGYDSTSLRDIATRLGVTKAALYYYFAHKEDILLELHRRLHLFADAMIDELEATPDGQARVDLWPHLSELMLSFMNKNRDLMLLHQRNRNALVSLHATRSADLPDIDARMEAILASCAIPLRARVRMAAVTGVLTEVFAESAGAFAQVPPEELAQVVREAIHDLIGPPAARPVCERPAHHLSASEG
jgi:AcrR family transcriptional regulator